MSGNNSAMMAYAMDQLRREGVPEQNLRAAAAHLTGQAYMESSLNPDATHDGGTGYGIYGAGRERRDAMLGWLKENNYPNNSAEGQMRYMAHEAMTSGYGPTRGALMGASPDNLAKDSGVITADFERPRINNDRSAATINAYNSFDPNTPMAAPAQPTGGTAVQPNQQPQGGLLAALGINNPFGGTNGALAQPMSMSTPLGDFSISGNQPQPQQPGQQASQPMSLSGPLNIGTPLGNLSISGGQQCQQGGNDALKSLDALQTPSFGTMAPGAIPQKRPVDLSSLASLAQTPRLGLS